MMFHLYMVKENGSIMKHIFLKWWYRFCIGSRIFLCLWLRILIYYSSASKNKVQCLVQAQRRSSYFIIQKIKYEYMANSLVKSKQKSSQENVIYILMSDVDVDVDLPLVLVEIFKVETCSRKAINIKAFMPGCEFCTD